MAVKAKYNQKYANPIPPGRGDAVWTDHHQGDINDEVLEELAPKEWPGGSIDSKTFAQFTELEKGTAPDRG